MHAYITTEVTEPAIKVSLVTPIEREDRETRARGKKKEGEKCCNNNVDRKEERGYIIYTGLKGLHKNGEFAKKNGGGGGGGAS